ncbi:hypothetical protein OF829_17265 [Sphingomonas sp. LB-2]|uniref:hypothetical protein n=1 Tax=Sphingomonas caeni TaxID=2984949 RepID=UPI00222F10D6|nr:hypothetical protein [Sphingomonas caeni]MCW3848991.1 hypothetical protein [Sphingomonas caeni]
MTVPAGPVIVAHATNRASQEITGHFMALHAISAGDAAAFVPRRPAVQREFDRMRAAGVVREAIKGHYWLDVPAYYADVQKRRSKMVPIVIAVSLAIAGAIMLLYGFS